MPTTASGAASLDVFVDGRFWIPALVPDEAVPDVAPPDVPWVAVWAVPLVCGAVCTPATVVGVVVVVVLCACFRDLGSDAPRN